ncbi:MAG: replication initiation factor domain-containing protein [Erysipelotrichales bacterium]|nr:replication initiation factor domain-containing protein [Erysipelotrichales bacterium]
MSICFDYLSFTIPLKNSSIDKMKACLELCQELALKMGFVPDEIFQQERVANGFKFGWDIGEHIIFRGLGPIMGSGFSSCQLELKGSGCRELEERDFIGVLDLIVIAFVEYQANFTRVDIAIDDFLGNHSTIEKIELKLMKKHYTSSFRKPYNRNGNMEDGYTLYLGSRKSTLLLCIYDKMRERQASGYDTYIDFWTRYEMRFMKEKANALVRAIIGNGNVLDIKDVAFGSLLKMLNIKEDNNYNKENQEKVITASWWLSFLENASRLELKNQAKKESTITTMKIWRCEKLAKMDNKIRLASKGGGEDKERVARNIDIIQSFERMSAKDLYIINKDRVRSNLKPLNLDDIKIDISELIGEIMEIESRTGILSSVFPDSDILDEETLSKIIKHCQKAFINYQKNILPF